jgi:hypothetical protein
LRHHLRGQLTPEQRASVVAGIASGKIALRLEREPTNAYDPNAVKVLIVYEGRAVMWGYIPATSAGWVGGLLSASAPIEAVTASIDAEVHHVRIQYVSQRARGV